MTTGSDSALIPIPFLKIWKDLPYRHLNSSHDDSDAESSPATDEMVTPRDQ